MKFTFTDSAIAEIQKRYDLKDISLFYAVGEDCGCPSTGIFMLKVNDAGMAEYDAVIETNIGPVPAQKWALVFLDSDNVVDFNATKRAFQLKSERGFLNMNLLLEQTVAQ
jgi:uncharacterized protein YqkB